MASRKGSAWALRIRLIRAVALATIAVAAIAIAPHVALANSNTGGCKGPFPGLTGTAGNPWLTKGNRQNIETQAPYWMQVGSVSYVAMNGGLPFYSDDIAQVGYGKLNAVGYFVQPQYFYEFDDESTGYYAQGFSSGPVPAIGSTHTYQMAIEGNLWVARIDGASFAHTGTDHTTWAVAPSAPNGQQSVGEVVDDMFDYFDGNTGNHVSFTNQAWLDQYGNWHGGALYQYHTTAHGKNDIISANGQTNWTIWDSQF